MPCVARGSPTLMVVSGALWSPLSGAAAGWPCRPPRMHMPVGAAPPAAGASIARLRSWLAGAGGAGGGRAARFCRMPARLLSTTHNAAMMQPVQARRRRTTRRWSTLGLARHHCGAWPALRAVAYTRSVGPKMAKKNKIARVGRRNVFLDQLFTLITNPVLKGLGHE